MSDPVIVSTLRTVRVRIDPATNPGKLQAIDRTQAEWHRAVEFYTAFFLDHLGVFAETKTVRNRKGEPVAKPWTAQDLLTWAERGTVRTEAHPDILREFAAVCPQMPTVLRRAAINAASGAVKSYRTIHQTWDQTDPRQRGQEPPMPDPHPFLTLYDGMVDGNATGLRQGFLRLKGLDDGGWQWMAVPVALPPYALDLFDQSEAEVARIAGERAEQNARMVQEGRVRRTQDEKERLRPTPGIAFAQSPTLVRKPGGWFLHVPFLKRVVMPGKAEARRLAEPDLTVGTLDLNADSTVGVAWVGDRVADVHTLWHAQENAQREKTLQQVARNQRASGRPVKGERSNQALWRSIRGRDAALAWRMAALIVAWAVAQGLQVLVFEYLRPYRPTRGHSWSRRTNRKRSYWLRGQIRRHVRDLALRQGILVVERHPAWTSQVCPHCHRLAERFSPGGAGYPSRLRCGGCGWSGDANVAAALNLKRKWDRTFRYPTKAERQAAELRRAGNGGAAVNPEQVPAAV